VDERVRKKYEKVSRVCERVCEAEKERERERKSEKVCVCVCVCASMSDRVTE
jgi:hypothetical protein